jgi:crotonobetainyl-CoA:carnitine CoA-transferase CaiB-like acyl-CoA transferase
MNGMHSAAGPRARRNWLPPAIAAAVTGASGVVALAGLASGALTDVPPYPVMGWLSAGLYAQAALGAAAVTLLIVSRVTARGQHIIARLGWTVTALSLASITATTLLAGPA